MPSRSSKPSPGHKRKPRAWFVSRKSKIVQLTFGRSRKGYSKVTLLKLLRACLLDCFVRSLQTLRSASATTKERQVLSRASRHMRTARSLTTAYLEWRKTFSEFSKMTDGSPFFLIHTATTEIYTLSLHDALPI